jgi:ribonucleotide monophosphatase NagD (HAD superfamily)
MNNSPNTQIDDLVNECHKHPKTMIVDIDGVLVDSKTEEAIPGAVETVNRWYKRGHRIVLMTYRGSLWGINSRFNIPNTQRLLSSIGVKYHDIVYNCPSPRYLLNDSGAVGVDVIADESWDLLVE